MRQSQTIAKERLLPASQNYALLRDHGQRALETLSSDLWTDFNLHDPGVTILEVVCFALTELGFRTGLPIEDLLARPSDHPGKDFFTAAEILTCNPVTVLDLRKLIIDHEGVRNGWLVELANPPAPASPRPVFSTICSASGPAYSIRLDTETAGEGAQPKILNGLYDVALQLDDDDEFGDLNSNVLEWPVEVGAETVAVKLVLPRVELEFPSWDYPIATALDYVSPTNPSVTAVDTTGLGVTFDWNLRFENTDGDPQMFTLPAVRALGMPDADFNALRSLLESSAQDSLSAFLLRRTQRIVRILCDVYCGLHEHRNLCEDYVRFSIVPFQDIGMCAEIEVSTQGDLERLLAEIIFELDRFLSPPVGFYTLEQMRASGWSVEEIFEGLVPEHGFIDSSELAESELKSELHVSDLYRIIMEHAEVLSVPTLLITNYLDGVAQTDGEPWCLKLGDRYHLNLNLDKSRITFLRDGLPVIADKMRVLALIRDLEAQHDRPKLDLEDRDLPVPQGTVRALDEYVSVQNDFPLVYGIGKDGLASDAPAPRRAQAKQLKAYLMFFDQLLANFMSQSALVKDLLSVDPPVPMGSSYADLPSYAVQPLYRRPGEPDHDDFPEVQHLLQAFVETAALGWEAFAADDNNDYLSALRSIAETEEVRLARRNAFLDHLLARFAESFDDYALLVRDLAGVHAGSLQLLDDKRDFLSVYPQLSGERGKGLQAKCYESDVDSAWQESNVTGLQKRVARLGVSSR